MADNATERAQADEAGQDGGPEDVTAEEINGEWVFLIDPAWRPEKEDDEPPASAVVGGWFVNEEGTPGYFRPNPAYEPSSPDLPTDPVDAVLQLVVRGEATGEEVLEATQDVIFSVAVDEEGVAVVAPAPDDVPSVLVTTAPRHRERVTTPGWMEVTIAELAGALPDEGVDILLNPGRPASMRVRAAVVKEYVAQADESGAENAGAEVPAEPADPAAGAVNVVSEAPTATARRKADAAAAEAPAAVAATP